MRMNYLSIIIILLNIMVRKKNEIKPLEHLPHVLASCDNRFNVSLIVILLRLQVEDGKRSVSLLAFVGYSYH